MDGPGASEARYGSEVETAQEGCRWPISSELGFDRKKRRRTSDGTAAETCVGLAVLDRWPPVLFCMPAEEGVVEQDPQPHAAAATASTSASSRPAVRSSFPM